jgi:hypothetical protein
MMVIHWVITEIIKKTLIDAGEKVGLEVNAEEPKYMLLFGHQNAGQNYGIKIGKRCFENVGQFRYLGTTITDQNFIYEEIRFRTFSSCLLYKNAY